MITDVFFNCVANSNNDLYTAVGFAKFVLVVVVTILEERIRVNLDLLSPLACLTLRV